MYVDFDIHSFSIKRGGTDMIKQNVREETIKVKNNLLLAEIDQYHAVIKDFSNQSASIKNYL